MRDFLTHLTEQTNLCKCDWFVFGDVFSILACKHPTVTAIHLLGNLLKG